LNKEKRQGRIEKLTYFKFESSISLQLSESTHAKLQSKKTITCPCLLHFRPWKENRRFQRFELVSHDVKQCFWQASMYMHGVSVGVWKIDMRLEFWKWVVLLLCSRKQQRKK
jgi:hypothetical protein